jgi:mannose-6-phosphate isomerase-like protein (cupin superfamily)
MKVINLKEEASKIDKHQYKVIGKMNNHNFTLIKAKDRKLDFHSHPDSDEVFFIIEGEMKLEFEDKMLELKAGEMCIVPKGVVHRPVCETDVTTMLIEIDGTLTPDNTGGKYKG